MRARIALFALIFFVLTGCGATMPKGEITLARLIPSEKIKTPADAERALIIVQDFRLGTMRSVKKAVTLGLRPESDLDSFEKYDASFRKTWDDAYREVNEWKLTGDRELAFKTFYIEVLKSALDLDSLRLNSEVKPNA